MKTVKKQNITANNRSSKSANPTTGTINGHEWVDLGLSVKWATMNVGASSPSGLLLATARVHTTYVRSKVACTGRMRMIWSMEASPVPWNSLASGMKQVLTVEKKVLVFAPSMTDIPRSGSHGERLKVIILVLPLGDSSSLPLTL